MSKTQDLESKGALFKANWSGFISKDFSKPINEFRAGVLQQLQKVSNPTWRVYIGEVLLLLFENVSAFDVLKLLARSGYVDEKEFVKVSVSLGVDPKNAKRVYQKIDKLKVNE